MPQLSAVVIAGGPGVRARVVGQETAMLSALGRPLIDYVLEALRGSNEVSEVFVSVTPATPLTESHVQSRGYQVISASGGGYDSVLHLVMQQLSTPYVLSVPANLPLLRPESIDEVVDEFYRSKKASLMVGVPIDDVQEVISEPSSVMDMAGVRAIPCGVRVMDRDYALSRSSGDESYLVTDLEDFVIEVNTIGQLHLAEGVLRARQAYTYVPTVQ